MDARPEGEVFADLADLCRSPGFVHAVGYFDFRDNLIRYGDQLDAEAMESQHAAERLVRTEIATLIGLMVQAPIDAALPDPERFQDYVDRAQALLRELHWAMSASWRESFKVVDGVMQVQEPMWAGPNLREPIFYSGESAYGFQYRALALRKYAADDPWLLSNKGFEIGDAVTRLERLVIIRLVFSRLRSYCGRTARALPMWPAPMIPMFILTEF